MVSRWAALAIAAALCVAAVTYRPETSVGDSRPLDAYEAVYLVSDLTADEPAETADRVEIRRPYDGRIETSRDGAVITGKITNRLFELQLTAEAAVQFAIRRQPGGPVRGISYAALRDAARAGVIEDAGTGELRGRRCTWFALGAPFPEELKPVGEERVDVCVDPAGFLVREVWTIGERVVRETELLRIRMRAPSKRRFFEGVDPADIDVTQPEAADVLGGQVVVSDEKGLPRPLLGLDVPKGWRPDRVSGIVQASPLDGSVTQVGSTTFLRGDHMVVVERSVRKGEAPWAAQEGRPIDAGVGEARVVYYGSHVEIRMTTDDAGFARVIAPDRRTAEAFADSLRLPD